MTSKREVLELTSFGKRIAEEEVDELAEYFVETNQWRQIFAGEKDIVCGDKGAGKSAIYSLLVSRPRISSTAASSSSRAKSPAERLPLRTSSSTRRRRSMSSLASGSCISSA